jgi:hypothetical protein
MTLRNAASTGLLLAFALVFGLAHPVSAQPPGMAEMQAATRKDHQNMMEQLGITKLRPGKNADVKADNAANYNEELANPYPDLPEALTLANGEKVTTPEQWQARRGEIIEDFEREVYGRVPKDVPSVKWEVKSTTEKKIGDIDVIEKQLEGVVDNSAHPEIEVKISATLGVPKNASGPVPVLMMFTFDFSAFARSVRPAPKAPDAKDAPAKDEPAKEGQAKTPPPPPRNPFGFMGPSPNEHLVKAGWGYCSLVATSIQPDNGAGLTKGIIGLTNKGQFRKPDDWGSLRAWAWGASRTLDYLETEPTVDAKRVGIEGVSRYGKAALVAMAFEPRFAVVLVGSSGEGGAKLHRRNFGEAVENLTGSGGYHWMAGNFLKYGTAESKFGEKTAKDLPVDSHQLIALCAPRLTFISYGIPEKGDANWLDQRGSYMATLAAGPTFRLLGAKDLGAGDDYLNTPLPKVNESLLDGDLAWRQHDGGHTDLPNFPHFLEWANKRWGAK